MFSWTMGLWRIKDERELLCSWPMGGGAAERTADVQVHLRQFTNGGETGEVLQSAVLSGLCHAD